MKLRGLTPMLGVADVQQSINFYTEVLGFKLGDTSEHAGAICWAHLCHGETELMLTEVANPEAGREGRRQTYLYFYPDNVVALHSHLAVRGHSVQPLRVAFYGMKEFEMEDPDGYQLWFGEETDEPPTDCE